MCRIKADDERTVPTVLTSIQRSQHGAGLPLQETEIAMLGAIRRLCT